MKLYKLSVIIFPLAFMCNQGQCQETVDRDEIKRKWIDIPYATLSDAEKLDIYIPDTGTGPFPVIVSVHGGAFLGGDKADRQVNPMLQGLKKGYAVVSINYRLSGEALFPGNINDVKAAIRWIRANATVYHLDPSHIAVWGGSAGGNLSALAGTSGGIAELEDLTLGNPGMSCKVQAVVDWFGPIDFLTMDEQFIKSGKGTPDHNLENSPESKVLGKKITMVPDLVHKANPASYISGDDPPFFIEHGKNDQLVPVEQSVNFAAELKQKLGDEKVTLVLLENTKHGGQQFETGENLKMVFDFLDRWLK